MLFSEQTHAKGRGWAFKLCPSFKRELSGGDITWLPYKHAYKRGVGNILGHILKFMNLLHILANITGTYGV